LLAAVLGLASPAARAEPPAFDSPAHDEAPSPERKAEKSRR